jgi:hypothetical protein
MFTLIFGIIMIVGGIITLVIGKYMSEKDNILKAYVHVDNLKNIPDNVPMVVKGVIESEHPLTTPVTHKPAIYYRHYLQERLESEDSNGQKKVKWENIGKPEEQRIPFVLSNDTGKITIQPDNATMDSPHMNEHIFEGGSLISEDKDKKESLVSSMVSVLTQSEDQPSLRKSIEITFFVGETVYVFAKAGRDGNGVFLQNDTTYPMTISLRSKEQLVRSNNQKTLLTYTAGVMLILIGFATFLQ